MAKSNDIYPTMVRYECATGVHVEKAIRSGIEAAAQSDCDIQIVHNEIVYTVLKSDVQDLVDDIVAMAKKDGAA